MFIDVEQSGTQQIEGFKYSNKDSDTEYVEMNPEHSEVSIKDSVGGSSTIYVEDIPKLINALELAYKYKTGDNI